MTDDAFDDGDDDGGAWARVLTTESTPADLEAAIVTWTAWALEHVRQIANDPFFRTEAERAAILAFLEPLTRQQTRAAFESAYRRLRNLHVH